MKRTLVSVLMIFALVSALVSPACAFVNGSMGFIEICTSDGNYKTIAISGEEIPNSRAHKAQPDCAFCFSIAHAQAFSTDKNVSIESLLSYIKIGAGTFIPCGLTLRSYQAQGPPSFV